ncbi:hypothetical protein Tco_0754261 [Tanacetum coccineum]
MLSSSPSGRFIETLIPIRQAIYHIHISYSHLLHQTTLPPNPHSTAPSRAAAVDSPYTHNAVMGLRLLMPTRKVTVLHFRKGMEPLRPDWCPPRQALQIFGVALEGADSV